MTGILHRLLVSKTILVALGVTGLFVYVIAAATPSFSSYSEVKEPPPRASALVVGEGSALALNVSAYVVFNVETGQVLFAQDQIVPYPIASVTKLITAAAVLTSAQLSAAVTLTAADVATDGRAGKLESGQQYTRRELLFPLLLESSNDAATALEHSAPLLTEMNALVHGYGATAMNLMDTSGLSPENVASAQDLVVVVSRLYADEPHLFDITRLTQYVGPYTGWVNNSPFINDVGYVGGKHGFTEAAGRTAAALFNEELSGATRTLGYVVLGSHDLEQDVATLRALVQQSVRLE